MTPQLRKVLKSVSTKNKALQEILRSSKEAVEVVSVEKQTGGVHNTKTTLKMLDNKQRVQFYNRIDIASFIDPEFNIPTNDIQNTIDTLNTMQDCDFNEDDLEIVDGWLKAKDISLGYIGKIKLPVVATNDIFIAMFMDMTQSTQSQAARQGIRLTMNGISSVGMEDPTIGLKIRETTYVPNPPPSNPQIKPISELPFPLPIPSKEGMVLLFVINMFNITKVLLDSQWDLSIGNETNVLEMIPFGNNPSIVISEDKKRFSYQLIPLLPTAPT